MGDDFHRASGEGGGALEAWDEGFDLGVIEDHAVHFIAQEAGSTGRVEFGDF